MSFPLVISTPSDFRGLRWDLKVYKQNLISDYYNFAYYQFFFFVQILEAKPGKQCRSGSIHINRNSFFYPFCFQCAGYPYSFNVAD